MVEPYVDKTSTTNWPLSCSIVLVCLLILGHPGPHVLYGVDAGCYARIAMDLANQPLQAWSNLRLAGQPFVDHPPLAIWLEAAWLTWFGLEPEQLIWLARTYMVLLVVLLSRIAKRWADHRVATMTVLSLLSLPGFHFEAHNPMLELPLTVAIASAILASTATSTWVSVLGFTLSSLAAWLIKGPTACILLLFLIPFACLKQRKRAYWLLFASLLALLAVGLVFIALGETYIEGYWYQQVLASLRQQRDLHAVRHSFLFYPKALWGWYGPGLICLPLALWFGTRSKFPSHYRRCLYMAASMIVGVTAFFMMIPKQNTWYIHPSMLFFALIMGCLWQALLPWHQQQKLVLGAMLAGVFYLSLGALYPKLWQHKRQGLITIHTQPAPNFSSHQPREIANCSSIQGWRADHLFALKWHVKAVPCHSNAPYVLYDNGWEPSASRASKLPHQG